MPLTNYDCQGDIMPFESKCSISLPEALQPTITSAARCQQPLSRSQSFPACVCVCSAMSRCPRSRRAMLNLIMCKSARSMRPRPWGSKKVRPKLCAFRVKPLLLSSCCSSCACFLSHTSCGVAKADLLLSVDDNLTQGLSCIAGVLTTTEPPISPHSPLPAPSPPSPFTSCAIVTCRGIGGTDRHTLRCSGRVGCSEGSPCSQGKAVSARAGNQGNCHLLTLNNGSNSRS